jgi:hypothetical protein
VDYFSNDGAYGVVDGETFGEEVVFISSEEEVAVFSVAAPVAEVTGATFTVGAVVGIAVGFGVV